MDDAIPSAEYLRVSTEHQQYSLEYQFGTVNYTKSLITDDYRITGQLLGFGETEWLNNHTGGYGNRWFESS